MKFIASRLSARTRRNSHGSSRAEADPPISLDWSADLWWRLRYGALYTEGKLVKISGETFGGVPFPLPNQKKGANITSGVVRVGYLTDDWDAIMEVGHASGDAFLADEEPMALASTCRPVRTASQDSSNGGVINEFAGKMQFSLENRLLALWRRSEVGPAQRGQLVHLAEALAFIW